MPYRDPAKKRACQVALLKARRQAWLQANGPCRQCGSSEALEVDHVDPANKVTHRIWSWSQPRREAELANCQVLCASCHKGKTLAFLRKPIVHGTRHAYSRAGCRCRDCRSANASYNRQLRSALRSEK